MSRAALNNDQIPASVNADSLLSSNFDQIDGLMLNILKGGDSFHDKVSGMLKLWEQYPTYTVLNLGEI